MIIFRIYNIFSTSHNSDLAQARWDISFDIIFAEQNTGRKK